METRWIEETIGPPAECPGDWLVVNYRLAGREIRLLQPRDPDRLLDDPSVQQASHSHDYMPYWGYLWPGSLLLAEWILQQSWPGGRRAVEIGCGLGLAGLAGLGAGLDVTFTDYTPAELSAAARNAQLNGFARYSVQLIDWQHPPRAAFDLVLGADVLYESRCVPDALRVLEAMLSRDGEAILADPNRAVADAFEPAAQARGFLVRRESIRCSCNHGRPIEGRLFRCKRLQSSFRPEPAETMPGG